MAESLKLVAEPRQGRGSHLARRLRRQGRVPGIVYGHKEAVVPVSLSVEDMESVIRHAIRVVDLDTDGRIEKALIREIQWDHLGKEMLHVDFARIAADERVVVTVPLEIRGTAVGIAAGGVLDQPMHTLPIECLAISMPGSIRVNVAELQLGSALHVRDLVLPDGVKAMADPELVVVQVKLKEIEAEAAPAPAAELAEPELIGRVKVEEEEEAE